MKITFSDLNFQAKIKMAFLFRRNFCHAVLDSREQQVIPPDLFDHARSIAIGYIGKAGEDFLLVFAHFFCSNIAQNFYIENPIKC